MASPSPEADWGDDPNASGSGETEENFGDFKSPNRGSGTQWVADLPQDLPDAEEFNIDVFNFTKMYKDLQTNGLPKMAMEYEEKKNWKGKSQMALCCKTSKLE